MVMAAAVALDACGEATVALDQVTVQYVDGSLVARGGVGGDGVPWRGGTAAVNASAYCITGMNGPRVRSSELCGAEEVHAQGVVGAPARGDGGGWEPAASGGVRRDCTWQRSKELGLLAPGHSSSAVPCGRIDVGRAGWRAGQAPGAAPLDLVCVCAGRGRGDGAGYCSIASAVSVEQRARVSIAECLFRHCGRGVVDVRQVSHPT